MKRIGILFLVLCMVFPFSSCSLFSKSGTINVLDEGIVSGEGIDNAKALTKLFQSLSDGATVLFPEGTYEFNSAIYLSNKKNINIIGENAVLVRSGLDNAKQNATKRTAAFIITGCSNITMKGITVKHSGQTSVSGEIVNVNRLLGVVDISLYDGFDVSGDELFNCLNTFDEEGIPDKRIEHYCTETPFVISSPKENKAFTLVGLTDEELAVAKEGDRVCLRSMQNDYLFIILNSNDMLFEDVTVNDSYNGAFLFEPYCFNATFRRLKIVPEQENALMSTNCDGIHISGLGGELILEDCEFYNLGDDCLNVHTTAGIVNEVSNNTVSFTTKFSNPRWAKAGDIIEFYDDTFTSLGTAVVKKIRSGKATFDSLPEGVTDNTVLCNKTLHPSVTITGNRVFSNRARAFLLQTENVVVENCNIYGTALPAVLVSPDIAYWHEMSPGKNITIRNNTFENCGKYFNGVIQLASSHDGNFTRYKANVNENITVEDNVFKNCNTSAVFAASTNGLTVKNNIFDDDYNGDGSKAYAVYALNSDNILVYQNKLKNSNDTVFGGENYNSATVE